MYVRMTFPAMQVYETLEPLLEDYRKLRYRHQSEYSCEAVSDMSDGPALLMILFRTGGAYTLTHIDEFVDELLTQERVCELILPRITKREVLEETEGLAPRISRLEEVILHGKSSGGARRSANGARAGSDDEEGASGAESDDSLRARREEQRRRIQRAAQVRAKREAEELARAEHMLGTTGTYAGGMQVDGDEDEEEVGYASQEDTEEERSERYVSRSPSRSVSSDRQQAEGSDAGSGYRSRSGSRSPDRSPSPGYRSRSGSRSPDR